MFLNSTDLTCSAINQSTYVGNPAVLVGETASSCPTASQCTLGALTLIGNVPGNDAAGMALYNAGGGGGASVSLDMYNINAPKSDGVLINIGFCLA